MVVINNSPPLCNYSLHLGLSTIFTSTDYYGGIIYLPTVIVQYIHTYITPYIQLKVVKKLKDHRLPLSLAKDWTDFILSDKSRSSALAYVIGSLDRAICIALFDPLGAGIPTRMYQSPVCSKSKPWFAEAEAPGLFLSTTLDNRTDGVSQ